eukprot:Rmarinus@m.22378
MKKLSTRGSCLLHLTCLDPLLCFCHFWEVLLSGSWLEWRIAFFNTMSHLDERTAVALQRMPFPSILDTVYHSLKNVGKMAVMSVLVLIVSMIPMVRWLLFPAFNFMFLRKKLGSTTLTLVISGFYLIPGCDESARRMVNLLLASRTLARELLDPYISRAYKIPEQPRVLKRHSCQLLGFFFPWMIVLSLPYVGPFFIMFAHAAAAEVAYKMLREDFLVSNSAGPPAEMKTVSPIQSVGGAGTGENAGVVPAQGPVLVRRDAKNL